MRVLSVNVGTPRVIGALGGRPVVSGINKASVPGPVAVRHYNLEGDRQADLSVHGGEEKAVYLYPSEHYLYWREILPERSLEWGSFGENLTTEGLEESTVHVGDRIHVGTVELEVTRPRFPCSKLGLHFGTDRMIKMFLRSGRTGFYLRIVREGTLSAGDRITLALADPAGTSIAALVTARRAEE